MIKEAKSQEIKKEIKYWINTGFYEASARYYLDANTKHDVRSCGCNFTKCPLPIGREKHWFQSQFQAASVSASLLKLETFFQVNFSPACWTNSFTAGKFLVNLVKSLDHQKTKKYHFSTKLFSL